MTTVNTHDLCHVNGPPERDPGLAEAAGVDLEVPMEDQALNSFSVANQLVVRGDKHAGCVQSADELSLGDSCS